MPRAPRSGVAPAASELAPAASPLPPADLDPRTGEPRRPVWAWVAGGLLFAATGTILVALLVLMWDSVRRFDEASALHRLVRTELGDPLRALLAAGDWTIAVLIGAAAAIAGYYGWAGHRWARWAGVVAFALGWGSLALNWLAPWCLLPLALGAAALWLPQLRPFYAAWDAARQPAPTEPRDVGIVQYGPLPRYR